MGPCTVAFILHPRARPGRAGGPRGLCRRRGDRPAVMFGPDDAFLNTLIKLLRRLPVYPMFGRGETRLQPADVEDVAEAVARVMQRTETGPLTVECGGPRVILTKSSSER